MVAHATPETANIGPSYIRSQWRDLVGRDGAIARRDSPGCGHEQRKFSALDVPQMPLPIGWRGVTAVLVIPTVLARRIANPVQHFQPQSPQPDRVVHLRQWRLTNRGCLAKLCCRAWCGHASIVQKQVPPRSGPSAIRRVRPLADSMKYGIPVFNTSFDHM